MKLSRRNVKLIAGGFLLALVLVVILQNTDRVQTNVLFWNFSLPRAVWMFVTTAIGFLLGMLTVLFGKRR